jgi:two-component system CheB/CheR fusion protein
LHAYLEILKRMPCDIGMAFLVLGHCAINDAHLLIQALSTATPMPVLLVEQGTAILPDHTYVMPPGVHMRTTADHFEIAAATHAHGWPDSISVCLRSAAATLGPRVVAIMLSGDGWDGSSEMRWIKARGGVTMAQSRADHPGMPIAAEQTGYVDAVAPCEKLAAKLQVLAEIPVQSNHDSEANDVFEGPVSAFDSAPQNRLDADIIIQTERRVMRSTISLMSSKRAIKRTMIAIARSQELLRLSERVPATRREERLKDTAQPDGA